MAVTRTSLAAHEIGITMNIGGLTAPVEERSFLVTAIRLGLSGLLGFGASFVLYELFFWLLPADWPRATIAYFVGYAIGVVVQHALHRLLVFGYQADYWRSLRRTYLVYIAGLSLGAILNYWLVETTSLHHRVIWVISVLLVSILNLIALKLWAFRV